MLEPDFVDGLLKLCKAAAKERNGAGYIEDPKKGPVVLLTNADHIRRAIHDDEETMEVCGLNKLCFAYFETSLESLLTGELCASEKHDGVCGNRLFLSTGSFFSVLCW